MTNIQNVEGVQELEEAQVAKLEQLAQNEEFVNAILSSEKPEQIVELFQNQGFEVTADQAEKLRDFMVRIGNGELTDEELEQINGGVGVLAGLGFALGAFFGAFVLSCGLMHGMNYLG